MLLLYLVRLYLENRDPNTTPSLLPSDYSRAHISSFHLRGSAHTPTPSTLHWASHNCFSSFQRRISAPQLWGPNAPVPARMLLPGSSVCLGACSCAPSALRPRAWAVLRGQVDRRRGRSGEENFSFSLPSPLINCCPHSLGVSSPFPVYLYLRDKLLKFCD